MKRILYTLIMAAAIALQMAGADREVKYEYKGQTLTYRILDEEALTCETYWLDHELSGTVEVPSAIEVDTLAYTVVAIGEYSFYNSGIDSIALPETITRIGSDAFKGATLLKSLDIPSSVTEIGTSAFQSCHSLKEVVIPNSVVRLEDCAFGYCRDLKSVVIGNGVVELGGGAFNSCKALEEVIFGNSIETIGGSAFYDCTLLQAAELPSTVKTIGSYAFAECRALETVDLGESLVSIGSEAFAWCNKIKSVELPNTLKHIGFRGFYWCTGLESIEVGDSLETIGSDAFHCCSKLKEVVLPNTVTEISDFAFSDCPSLTSIELGNSIKTIQASTFSNCSQLKSIVIPNSVISIEESAFRSCSSLESVEFGSSLRSIGRAAFDGCHQLKKADIPPTVTWIGAFAFEWCEYLTDLWIPASLTTIEESVFSSCLFLAEINVPSSVTTIKGWAFDNPTTVNLGAGVKSIGPSVFSLATLENLSITAQTPPELDSSNLNYFAGDVYVQDQTPDQSIIAAYKAAPVWSRFNYKAMTVADSLVTSQEPLRYETGTTQQLTAEVAPEDATLKRVFWISTNPEVATVDNHGLVTYHALPDSADTDTDTALHECKIIASTMYANGPVVEFTVDGVSSGIADVIADGADGGFDPAKPYRVYDLRGVHVASDTTDGLPAGIYILRQGSAARKVAVK